jgi:hypothetical protein
MGTLEKDAIVNVINDHVGGISPQRFGGGVGIGVS